MIAKLKQVISSNGLVNMKCHHDHQDFRNKCYTTVRLILDSEHQENIKESVSFFPFCFHDNHRHDANEHKTLR